MPDTIRVITLAKQGPAGPPGGRAIYVATATNLVTAGQNIVGVTDTTAPRTITISSDDIGVSGHLVTIKDESGGAGTNTIVVDTEGSETIDGVSSLSITVDFGTVSLYSNGSDLFTR